MYRNIMKKWALLALTFVFALPLVVGAQILEEGYYNITNKRSGKNLDVRFASTAGGADVIQWSANGDDNQIWLLQYDETDDTYLIIAKHSEKCLDIRYASTSNGANATQWNWNDELNQKWKIYSVGGGYYKLIAQHSGKCLEVDWWAGSSDGGTVQQWSYGGNSQQQWALTKLPIYYPGSGSGGGECSTQYPVLLLHGVALGDSFLGFNYFGRIPNHLRTYGADVEFGEMDAWSDSQDNAAQIKAKINWMLTHYGVSKVNILAHSKGGIDTRAMIMDDPTMASKIASFTTLATPHRGSVLADIGMGILTGSGLLPYVARTLNVIGMMTGDESSDSEAGGRQLTLGEMATFNADMQTALGYNDLNSGINGVYCQSYAGAITGIVCDVVLQATGVAMVIGGESPNDGAVWVDSAKYANWKGVQSGWGGLTHFGIVDRGILIFPGYTPGFSARDLYKDIVADLKNRGY